MKEYCYNCGEKIDEDSKFCHNCGEDFNDDTDEITTEESFIKRNKLPLLILGVTALIVLILVIMSAMSSTGPVFPLESDATQRVDVGGHFFTIPLEYMLDPTSMDIHYENMVMTASKTWGYSNENIGIMVLTPSLALDDYSQILAANGGVPTTMYGRNGYMTEDIGIYSFAYEENHRIYIISVSSPYIFNEIEVN